MRAAARSKLAAPTVVYSCTTSSPTSVTVSPPFATGSMMVLGPSTVPSGVMRKRWRDASGMPESSAVTRVSPPVPDVENDTPEVSDVHEFPFVVAYSMR